MQDTVQGFIAYYHMLPHPEGGYYKETYRSPGIIAAEALPGFNGDRHYCTAIYFLLQQGDFSAFHRIKSDECWHFYSGGPLYVYIIDEGGCLQIIKLGNNISAGETFQYVVPAGCWFASAPAEGSAFSFVGCTVSPGFDFQDFELAEKQALIAQYPQHQAVITQLTRG